MTPDEQAKLDRDRRTLKRRELEVERHEPIDGQRSSLDGGKRGWSLVTSKPLDETQIRAADELARVELEPKHGKTKKARKPKGGTRCP